MARDPDPRDPYQNLWAGASAGWAITGTLLSGLLVLGGLGYLIDWLVFGRIEAFTPAGMIAGAAIGIYLIYLRYGRQDDQRR